MDEEGLFFWVCLLGMSYVIKRYGDGWHRDDRYDLMGSDDVAFKFWGRDVNPADHALMPFAPPLYI
jgi:hypothetical protein